MVGENLPTLSEVKQSIRRIKNFSHKSERKCPLTGLLALSKVDQYRLSIYLGPYIVPLHCFPPWLTLYFSDGSGQ